MYLFSFTIYIVSATKTTSKYLNVLCLLLSYQVTTFASSKDINLLIPCFSLYHNDTHTFYSSKVDRDRHWNAKYNKYLLRGNIFQTENALYRHPEQISDKLNIGNKITSLSYRNSRSHNCCTHKKSENLNIFDELIQFLTSNMPSKCSGLRKCISKSILCNYEYIIFVDER